MVGEAGRIVDGATPAHHNVQQNRVGEKAAERSESRQSVCPLARRPAYIIATICFGALVARAPPAERRERSGHAVYTPLATASAITSVAPANFIVLAQLSMVAPVVNTSSKITRRLFLNA